MPDLLAIHLSEVTNCDKDETLIVCTIIQLIKHLSFFYPRVDIIERKIDTQLANMFDTFRVSSIVSR